VLDPHTGPSPSRADLGYVVGCTAVTREEEEDWGSRGRRSVTFTSPITLDPDHYFMTTTFRIHFTFRIDTWTPDGESIVEHVAGVEDYQVALATFLAACQRWPGIPITLRQGARVIEDSRRLRVV
jgi:hypothetical protein